MGKFYEVDKFIPENLSDVPLWPKIRELLNYVLTEANKELEDVTKKLTGPDEVREEVVKQILIEKGYDYIVSVMDTLNNLEFNTLITYVSLISQLKGSRKGLELVLRLLGFESQIREWWEADTIEERGEPWTYEITVYYNASNVPDIFETIEQVQVFSRNYVFALISNIEVQVILENFAEKAPIMGGFTKASYFGRIIQRAL